MALIRDPKLFSKGLLLMGSFIAVFVCLFMPWFGNGRNALEYSDDFFNKLSKSSSNFTAEVANSAKKFEGKQSSFTLKLADEGSDAAKAAPSVKEGEATAALLTKLGMQASVAGSDLKVTGDLGAMSKKVVDLSKLMLANQDKPVADALGADAKKSFKLLWKTIAASDMALKREKLVSEAKLLSELNKKIIEPAYNFFGIPEAPVSENIMTLIGLLVFYVIYTMWYGFAIFDLFGGMGLGMSKAKVKKEA